MTAFPLFQAILAEPPFKEWGVQRTCNIPIWRCTDPTGCVCVIITHLDYLKAAFTCLETWGFLYQTTHIRKETIYMFGKLGKIENPKFISKRRLWPDLVQLSTNRLHLTLDATTKSGARGWYTWSPYGWHQYDLFSYPIRKNHVTISEEVLDATQELRQILNYGHHWQFHFGDAVNRLVESQKLPAMKVYEWVEEAVGRRISKKQVRIYANVANNIPQSQRDSSIAWGAYVKLRGTL